ncbi:glutaminase A [Paenibacillus herberti]|uniref:Glutaminase n=1 Tax=Paenibacillus herberti TaxID=1619309 RepID=A0A229P2A1_9BACL|nr:glutaminase A [Paenibacillus herberti]OXM16181.1 glutaminase A [Paenibacillus herberti]
MNESNWSSLSAGLPQWLEHARSETSLGKVASYIPELSKADPSSLGLHIRTVDGRSLSAGTCGDRFTMQSISKVFTLILALMDNGEDVVFSKVGMEPTGDSFNSMLKLELVQPGIPFNPLINAGAIVISSLIGGSSNEEKVTRIQSFIGKLAGREPLQIDEQTYRSECQTGHLNRSMAYFLTDNGVLKGKVEDVLEVYFKHCSLLVDCADLARMALVLSLDGLDPDTGERLIPRRFVQIAKTFMVTCGMYNGSGEFAIDVGLPAKSGVSGGIMALLPGQAGIGIIGPSLNRHGNSVAGVHLLKHLSKEFDWSLF